MSPPRLMLLPVATQVAICGTLTCLLASGITSKPAIEDHFKTGQRTITLDELVLPYRLAVGKSSLTQSGPSSSALRCRLSYQPDVLQDDIPVLPFLRREVSFENQVTSSRSAGDARRSLANHL